MLRTIAAMHGQDIKAGCQTVLEKNQWDKDLAVQTAESHIE